MRARGRATGSDLAAATGLSAVTVYKELGRMEERGEVRRSEQPGTPRGGRPARVYECEAGYARRALLVERRRENTLQIELEVHNLMGLRLHREQSVWARAEPGSMLAWLESALPLHERVASIALAFAATEEAEQLQERLRLRYHCPVALLSAAEALADERENSATLYLPRGAAPSCILRRHGRVSPTGALELLPLPGSWATLDYTDHTLVEEMVARLLQALSCVLAPERIALHADFWSARLTERIRFNTHSKLRRRAPELDFFSTSPADAESAIRRKAMAL